MSSRPTKYAHVVKNLPKYPGDEPGRLELLGKLRDEILAPHESLLTDWNIEAQMLSKMAGVAVAVGEILNLGKRQIGTKRSAAAFATAYAASRTIVDILGDLKSAGQLLLDAYERMMVEQMEIEGVRSLRLETGASVATFEEPSGKVVDKEAFRLWCKAPSDVCMTCGGSNDAPGHQQTDLQVEQHPFEYHAFKPGGGYERQLQLWPSTMNAVVKERALNAEPAPDGVEVYARTMVRLNKV